MRNRLLKSMTLAALALGGAVHADDTEIYLGANLGASEARPNVVFVIDTSGSMNDKVENNAPTGYDPHTTYDSVGFDTTQIYYGSSEPTNPGTSNYFAIGALQCQNAGDGTTTGTLYQHGTYADNMGMFKASKSGYSWGSFSSSYHSASSYRECASDYGKYGYGSNTSKPYPSNSAAGWQSTPSGISFSNYYHIYTGNYLNYYNGPSGVMARKIDIIHDVLKNLIETTNNINLALVRFDGENYGPSNKGGYFMSPMMQLNDANRQTFKDDLEKIYIIDPATGKPVAQGWTPLAETLYEVTQFYRGGAVTFGLGTTPGVDDPATYSGSKYISPIKYQCQKNFVVIFTDGDPTYDTDADAKIKALPGWQSATGSAGCTGDCLDELAKYLKVADQSAAFNDNQNVITYTIGFGDGMSDAGKTLLTQAAANGGGKYFPAADAKSVASAFTSIITDIMSVNTTFTAPAVSVNAFNRLTNLNDLYFALFRPDNHPHWDGNIKHYRLEPVSGTMMIVGDETVPQPAIDPVSGYFKETSISYWHTNPLAKVVDGNDVSKGGAAEMMPDPDSRKVFTYLGDSDLTASGNKVHENNAAITTTLLGLDSGYADPATQRTTVLQWARGVDVNDDDGDTLKTDARTQMGDPLHTEPLLLTYGASAGTIDLTLFASTNEGYLHAIDANTGVEMFSFIPPDLLPKLTTLTDNTADGSHPYGLDGPLSAWVQDTDGTIGSGDHVYLYLTERRGGKNIYALDVTDRTLPRFKWRVEGGSTPWAELGQTWSRVNHVTLKYAGANHEVVIFGGGYDGVASQDDAWGKPPLPSSTGRAIFIADANTGAQLWRACPTSDCDLVLPDMQYSIPSDLRVLDIDGDGIADRIYVGDTGGQLWRFDILAGKTDLKSEIYGGVIANLSKPVKEASRKFYYPPSVSLSTTGKYLNIAIGSGFRAHPLAEDALDEFFVIRDPYVYGPATDPSTHEPIYSVLVSDPDADLYDSTTETTTCQESNTTKTQGLAAKHGWYYSLKATGEKCLAQALTSGGIVNFTTFSPVTGVSANICAPSQGTGRLYALSVEEGTACVDMNGDGLVDTGDVSVLLQHGGIPSRTIQIHATGNKDTVGDVKCVSTECFKDMTANPAPWRGAWKIINK